MALADTLRQTQKTESSVGYGNDVAFLGDTNRHLLSSERKLMTPPKSHFMNQRTMGKVFLTGAEMTQRQLHHQSPPHHG